MCIRDHYCSVVPFDYLTLIFHNLSMFVISSNRGVCLFFNLHLKKLKTGQIFKYYFVILLRKTLVLRKNIVPLPPLHHQHNNDHTETPQYPDAVVCNFQAPTLPKSLTILIVLFDVT